MTSRAVQYARYGGPEVLQVVEREDPAPGPGQVRLAVRAASVNPIDWKLRSGAFAGPTDAPERPVVAGSDVAGVVEAVGEGVTAFAVGDEVLGQAAGGAYAERALADVTKLVRKPPEVSWEAAASLGVVVETAYRTLALLGLGDPGADDGARVIDRMLLVGGASGGVGMIATQVALARGVRVVGTAGPDHQDAVAALGATPTPYGEGLVERVRALTDRVDAALDTTGSGALGDFVALTGSPAAVVTIADPDAEAHGVRASYGGTDEGLTGALTDFVHRLGAGTVRVPEIVTYPLTDAARAQEDNRTGAVKGKLVLLP